MSQILNLIQNVFSKGQLSFRVEGRTDNDFYTRGFKFSNNLIPHPQGPLVSRPGCEFEMPMKSGTDNAVFIEFQFNEEQAYLLCLGDQYARVLKDREIVKEASQNITGVTQANPAVVTVSSHGYSTGDLVYIDSVGGMTEINGRWFVVGATATNTFEIEDYFANGIDSTGFTAYTSGGTVEKAFEIATPWTSADLPKLTYKQSADTIFCVHEDYKMRSIGRISDTNWTVQTTEMLDGPYLPINGTATTITPSGTSGSITLTASTGIFSTADVGRQLRYRPSASNTWGYVEITGFTSATQVSATVKGSLSGTGASDLWRLSVFGGSTYGYPSCLEIHEERFVVGGAKVFYNSVGFSQTGLYQPDEIDFAPSEADGTVIDSNGLLINVGGKSIDRVAWLESNRALIVGTSSAEYSISGSGTGSREAIAPDRRTVQRESAYGARLYVRPQVMGNSVVYVDQSGRRMREIYYEFGVDGFISRDASIINIDLLKGGINRTAYQRAPEPITWMVRNDGRVIAYSFDKINEVEGFHQHSIARDGEKVVDVASISRPDTTADDVYFLVERTINETKVCYVERMTELFEDVETIEDAFFVDAGQYVVNNPASATVSGLWHLEGETVDVLADGSPHPQRTVSNGQISLDFDAEKVNVGFSYNKQVDLLPIEVRQFGSVQGRITRINEVYIKLNNTVGLEVGTETIGSFDPFPFNGTDNNLNQPAPLFTDTVRVSPPSGYERGVVLQIKNNQPLPLAIISVIHEFEINA